MHLRILALLLLSVSAATPAHATSQEMIMPCALHDPQAPAAPSTLTVRFMPAGEVPNARLHGSLTVPTPGYRAALGPLALEGEVLRGTLVVSPPDGMVIQVIDELAIDLPLEVPAGAQRIELQLDKSFNWGAEKLVCALPETP